MIRVLTRPDETEAVEEFFQLFKVPWAFYQGEAECEVLLCTAEPPPGVRAGLTLLFNSRPVDTEPCPELTPQAGESGQVQLMGQAIPVYTALGRLSEVGDILLRDADGTPVAGTQGAADARVVRVGIDLFREVAWILHRGQPVEWASVPTLDRYMDLLRRWMVHAGYPLVEIPPHPPGVASWCCLTHDVDFVGIRRHKLDHTMLGFLKRATLGSMMDVCRRRRSWAVLGRNLVATLGLPAVMLKLWPDFWNTFARFRKLEAGLSPTYFVLPFAGRPGRGVTLPHPERRAAPYGAADIADSLEHILQSGGEVALHGIDAWNEEGDAVAEGAEIGRVTGQAPVGVRMHWLCREPETTTRLERAGFQYDATAGYNETIGYRAGTRQVYQAPGATTLLMLPLHIQDVALFYPNALHLDDRAAWRACREIIQEAEAGGVLVVLWHMRSLAPERCWDTLYGRLLKRLREGSFKFGTAAQITQWFRGRRALSFETSSSSSEGACPVGPHGMPVPSEGFTVRTWKATSHGLAGWEQPIESTDRSWPDPVAGVTESLSARSLNLKDKE